MLYDHQIDAATESDPIHVVECKLSLDHGNVEVDILRVIAYTNDDEYEADDFDTTGIEDRVRRSLSESDMVDLRLEAEADGAEAWATRGC